MALNGLLDIELSVPEPAELTSFWERRGLSRTDDGVLGTADREVQLRVAEGTHRHLSQLHMSCDTEQDLADIAARIGAMGVESCVADAMGATVPEFIESPIALITAENLEAALAAAPAPFFEYDNPVAALIEE